MNGEMVENQMETQFFCMHHNTYNIYTHIYTQSHVVTTTVYLTIVDIYVLCVLWSYISTHLRWESMSEQDKWNYVL